MSNNAIVFLIFSMAAIAVSSLDIYIPASPQLASIFSVPETTIKFSFLIGPLASGLVGIPIGYFSDRKGRRPLLIFCLFVYWMGTMICAMSPSIGFFFLGRILQSIGVGGLLVLSSAILSDLFSGVALARYMGLYALLFPAAFAIAPIIGAQVYTFFGWRAIFFSLLFPFLPIFTALYLYMPETCNEKIENSFIPLFRKMTKSKLVLSLALTHALPITISVIFTANGAFLYHQLFHFDPIKFSYIQALPVTAQFLGTIGFRRFVQRSGLENALQIGYKVTGLYCLICLMMIFGIIQGPWITVAAVCFFTLGGTFVIISAMTILLDYSRNNKGLTVSFLSLIRNMVIAFVVTGANFLPHDTVSPIFTVMLLVSLATLMLITLTLKQLKVNPELTLSE